MAEEEFHEIQLNGKQLVFLFMAGTVAAVVIFLSGLMVGRNLQSPRLEAAAATEPAIVDPTRDTDLPEASASASDGTLSASSKEDLRYPKDLQDPTPVDEPLASDPKPAPGRAMEKTAAVEIPAAPAAVPAAAKPLAFAEPAGNGWVVQVQAVNSRAEAENIARRLTAKSYPAFVTQTGAGKAQYRVRVGKFAKKQDAEAMKATLERKEQFKPWVTR